MTTGQAGGEGELSREVGGNGHARHRSFEILLVEDNPGDVRLTREALRDGHVETHLSVVEDGVEALAFLRRQGRYLEVPRPDLVLMDLNLPKKDGRQVLEEMKRDDDLRRIPVVVLTTSKSDQDVLRMYAAHANCYIAKPVGLDEFMTVVRVVEDFWFNTVRLPPR